MSAVVFHERFSNRDCRGAVEGAGLVEVFCPGFHNDGDYMMKGTSGMLCRILLVLLLAGIISSRPVLADPASDAVNEAMTLIDAGRFPAALESVKRALALDPERVEAHLLYIRLMIDTGKGDRVREEYAQRLKRRGDALSHVLYGRTLADRADAVREYEKALKLDPALGWAHYVMATHYLENNNLDRAEEELREAIRVQPGFVPAMESLATLQLSRGDRDGALLTYRDTVSLGTENARLLYEYGSLLGKQGDIEESVKHLERANELSPNTPRILTNLAFMYLKQKRYDDSIRLYDEAIALVPSDPAARLNREVAKRLKSGRLTIEAVKAMEDAMNAAEPEEAIALYKKVTRLSPDFELAWLGLGQLYAATGRAKEAEAAFLKALELNPASQEASRMTAEFYLVAQQPRKAEPILQAAIARNSSSPALHAALGTAHIQLGRFVDAENDFRRAIDLLPPRLAVTARFNLARTVLAQGRLPEGAALLEDLLKDAPGFVQARVELGATYLAMEEFDKAKTELENAQEVIPKNEEITELLQEVQEKKAEMKRKSKTHMRAKHILVKTEEEARSILAKLKAGRDFATLARQYSMDPNAALGGDLGYFKKGELNPAIEKAVLALRPGQYSGIVKTDMGYHIVLRVN